MAMHCRERGEGWKIEDCCEPSCRTRYSFTPDEVDWILKKFKEGKNRVVCV
jgi:hypothetical protein